MPPSVERVADGADPRIAAFRAVADPELAREAGSFVAEGRLVVRRAIEAGFRGGPPLVSRGAFGHPPPALGRPSEDGTAFVADIAVFRGVTGYNIHRGCLALVQRPPARDWAALAGAASPGAPLVILERVANPDNIGGVFRNAAAFGAAAVLLSPGCSDPLYRKAVRTSMGAVLAVPFAVAQPWPHALVALREQGWLVAALTGAGETPIDAFVGGVPRAARVAWVLGHEGDGLAAATCALADVRVRIPMAAGVDSINVATAAAVALHVSRPR